MIKKRACVWCVCVSYVVYVRCDSAGDRGVFWCCGARIAKRWLIKPTDDPLCFRWNERAGESIDGNFNGVLTRIL